MAEISSPQTGDKPVTLWDVDGVFIIQATSVEGYEPPDGYMPYPGNKYLFYAPHHTELVRPFLGLTDAYYMTTYNDRAHGKIGTLLGLPELDWLKHEARPDGTPFARRSDAINEYFSGRPVAYITDDFVDPEVLGSWAPDRDSTGVPTLHVDVDINEGLRRQDIDKLSGWLHTLGIADI